MHKQEHSYFSIDEALHVYKYALKRNPTFGIDIFSNTSWDRDVIVLQKEETVKKGIPIKFGFFALLLCLGGESIRNINQYEFKISETSFQLIPPTSICSFENLTEKTDIYILLFTEEFIKANKDIHIMESVKMLFEFHKDNIDNIFLTDNLFRRVKIVYEDINIELQEKRDDYQSVVRLLILKLLFILKRAKIEKNTHFPRFKTQAERIANQYLILVEKHFIDLKKVSDYAKLLNITPKHLSETIRSIYNKNALSFIHHRIMQESLYLLEYTPSSINQIASLLQFNSPSDFSRFFKSHHKITPHHYRLLKE